jgi:hypothetical protein
MDGALNQNCDGLIFLLITGPTTVSWGFRKLREARLIENIATSKVQSAAIGLVELAGVALPRKPQRAPVSGQECCWWKCTVEEYRSSKNSHSWVAIAQRELNDLFYLQDSTGRVLVNPANAEIQGASQTWPLNAATRVQIEPVLGSWQITAGGWFGATRQLRIIEQTIAVQAPIFVLGQLASIGEQPLDQRARLMARLRASKNDPQIMAAADSNQDGQVDAQEWDTLRAQLEELFYSEERTRHAQIPNSEKMLVLAPADSPFVISTGTQKELLGSLRLFAPLGLWGGLALSALGVWWGVSIGWHPLFIIGLLAAGTVLGAVGKTSWKFNFGGSGL